MDDCRPHKISSLDGRKRKADGEEASSSVESVDNPVLLEHNVAGPSETPRQPTTASWATAGPLTTMPVRPDSDTQRSAKRPRIAIYTAESRAKPSFPGSLSEHSSPASATTSSSTSPLSSSSPSSSSPRHSPTKTCATAPSPPVINIDPYLPHIPPTSPLVNHHTLKELNLDSILRNSQLRHDLLFDPGLQFRPTGGHRKREMTEKYWDAILRELETGCTCVSFDTHGKPCPTWCTCCRVPVPSMAPVRTYSHTHGVLTLRMPSRLSTLLDEFLEVLLSVIQPLETVSGLYVNCSVWEKPMQYHAAQASHLRSLFDRDLILQEIRHGVFDLSGLFGVISETLKNHCAPMRDAAVTNMAEIARACAPGMGGTAADAIKAVRTCLELLEMMKLDIANHQLQTLRPFLVRTSDEFELKTFQARPGSGSCLVQTRRWLHTSHEELMALTGPLKTKGNKSKTEYKQLKTNQQIMFSVLRGITRLVFTSPCGSLTARSMTTCSSWSSSSVTAGSIKGPEGYPETMYLDSARLASLSREAADLTVLYMFTMLYRQLTRSSSSSSSSSASTSSSPSSSCTSQRSPSADELAELKSEIRAIAGGHVGHYLFVDEDEEDTAPESTESRACRGDRGRRAAGRKDIVLQVVAKAQGCSGSRGSLDSGLLKLGENWAKTHMRPGSRLHELLRSRLHEVVFGGLTMASTWGESDRASREGDEGAGTLSMSCAAYGLEGLVPEITALVGKLSRLGGVHLNTYQALYEETGVLEGRH